MISIKRGDIWLVNLDPTVGHEVNKVRPSVIIQNDLGNKYGTMTIIAPVSSKVERIYPIDVLIEEKLPGLPNSSKIMLNQIRAIDKRRLIRRVGQLDGDVMENVNDRLKISLALT